MLSIQLSHNRIKGSVLLISQVGGSGFNPTCWTEVQLTELKNDSDTVLKSK